MSELIKALMNQLRGGKPGDDAWLVAIGQQVAEMPIKRGINHQHVPRDNVQKAMNQSKLGVRTSAAYIVWQRMRWVGKRSGD